MSTSVVEICNLALQRLGANPISSLSDGSKNARECALVFPSARDALLRRHWWNFAKKRVNLAPIVASEQPQCFGAVAFELPPDYLKRCPPDREWNFGDEDFQIEGRTILTSRVRYPTPLGTSTSAQAPYLPLKYIWRVDDPTLFDPCFEEALVIEIAIRLCERLTQSNTKKADLNNAMKDAVEEAKKANAIDNSHAIAPTDDWISRRM